MMTSQEALAKLRTIVVGMDREAEPYSISPADGGDGSEGWWETSTGAEFGSDKLAQIEALISELIA